MKKKKQSDARLPEPVEDPFEEEEASDLEAAFLDDQGRGATTHGRRVRGRGLDERELHDLPDEPPPGYLE